MSTKKVSLQENNYELERELRKIVDANCEDIDYEGTLVDKNGIVEDIIRFLASTKENHYSLLKHNKS